MLTPRAVGAAIAVAVLIAACTGDDDTAVDQQASPSSATSDQPESDVLAAVPDDARVAVGAGAPRSTAYWVSWSTCSDDSKAEVAAANGGPDAGYFLVDDLLVDPGIGLGDRMIESCEEALAILADESSAGSQLARQALTAELNRQAGSEACGAIDTALPVVQALLASLEGEAAPSPSLTGSDAESLDRLTTLLAAYNAGELCR